MSVAMWNIYSSPLGVSSNVKFLFLLTSSGEEWQFEISTDIYCPRMAISQIVPTSSGQA